MLFSVLSLVSTYSILLACIIGMVRYANTLSAYRPFILFIWVGASNEMLSLFLVSINNNNVLNSNLYVLIEYLLLLLVFYKWHTFKSNKPYIILVCLGILVWLLDNAFIHSLSTINSSFRVYASLVVLLLSVCQIHLLINMEKKSLFRNAMFQICISFVFYFSFRSFFETFYILQPPLSTSFYFNLFAILWIINLISNLIYAMAILWIPTKQEFTIP